MTRKKTDRLSWFKMDAGAFTADTGWLSLHQVGIYIRLTNLYWLQGGSLPEDTTSIMRRIGAITEEDIEAANEVLKEFFPEMHDGQRHHIHLDQQLQEVSSESSFRRTAARKRWEGNKPQTTDADDF